MEWISVEDRLNILRERVESAERKVEMWSRLAEIRSHDYREMRNLAAKEKARADKAERERNYLLEQLNGCCNCCVFQEKCKRSEPQTGCEHWECIGIKGE